MKTDECTLRKYALPQTKAKEQNKYDIGVIWRLNKNKRKYK
jgi:hypothetical protein